MSNVNWQFQAAIPGGPSLLLNQPGIPIGAYDVASVDLAAGASGINVPIQPSSSANDVVFLVVSSDAYDAGTSYTVDALPATHALDGPHVLLGSGAVGFLNSSAPPQKLVFSTTKKASVQVTVGRNVP
jgi:hypothetical protein